MTFNGTSFILKTRKNQETRGREVGLFIFIIWLKDQAFLQRFGWLNPVSLLHEGSNMPAYFMWPSQALSDLVRDLEECCMGGLIWSITLFGAKVCFYRGLATERPLTSTSAKRSWFVGCYGLTSRAEDHIPSITHWVTAVGDPFMTWSVERLREHKPLAGREK